VRHAPCRSATCTVSQRDTHRIAVRHPPRRSATPTASQCDMHRFAVRHLPCRGATSKKFSGDPLTLRRDEPNIAVQTRDSKDSKVCAAVGGSGRAEEHNSSWAGAGVELAPPAAGARGVHLGQSLTGRIGVSPRTPAGGRLALVDESWMTIRPQPAHWARVRFL
jgi:hypothetical protein